MADTRDLLVEIGTEELPPKALKHLSEAFARETAAVLEKAELSFDSVTRYATPRRLSLLVRDLSTAQAAKEVQRRGPAMAAAFDKNGQATAAARGFARSCGVEVDQLARMETPKGTWLAHRMSQPGQPAATLIPAIVESTLARLPIPKRMRWGSLTVEFVRPVHWVVLLFGDEVINATILGIAAGRTTRGHRFHQPAPFDITAPSTYASELEAKGRVQADFEQRGAAIRRQVEKLAAELGGRAVIDANLLDEVTALVEWPVAVAGSFDERFLDVPAEALVATMKGHQKYFHLVDGNGRLMPHFIAIANIESEDVAQVRAGNERVIRPRLADAEFFWTQDRGHSLESRREQLKDVVFQEKLGSVSDKCIRVGKLAAEMARLLDIDPSLVRRAAELCKCDLLTEMVGEFPELQGTMGRYYALNDGEPDEVAAAMDEQYMPRFAGDALPATTTGQLLALADRLDTLVGIFGIGQSPTGDKDPFALRRAALGVLRILIERDLELDLAQMLLVAARAYDLFEPEPTQEQVFDFVMERLRGYYQDTGVAPDTFEAVLARRPTRPLDFDRRVRAVSEFRKLPEAASLAAANKRIQNILRKAEGPIHTDLDPNLLTDPAEQNLALEIEELRGRVEPLLDRGDYTTALTQLAGLRNTVDQFFDQVLVMCDDEALRNNRLALLSRVSRLFLRTGDISRLQTERH